MDLGPRGVGIWGSRVQGSRFALISLGECCMHIFECSSILLAHELGQ